MISVSMRTVGEHKTPEVLLLKVTVLPLELIELKNVDVMLSLVYDGKILHEKIKMMKYFNGYSFCLENGGIIFPSISALIKYHNLNVALPLPCLLKEKVN